MIIKNGLVVCEKSIEKADILLENGKISCIANELNIEGKRILDAEGCYVFPGFIDTHTHFSLNAGGIMTADDFMSGTLSALLGGTTTIIDFADHQKGRPLYEALEYKKEKAKGSHCNYSFHMALSSWGEDISSQMADMVKEGISSFKMYMVYDMRMDDGEIFQAMKRAASLDCLPSAHCENYYLLQCLIKEQIEKGVLSPIGHALSRPPIVEAEAIARFLYIAMLAESPAYVVHLSTARGLEAARQMRENFTNVYLETCPQYLMLDESRYSEPDGEKYVLSPPLRPKKDLQSLTEALTRNDVDTVGTDHCSFNMNQKKKQPFSLIPNGIPGVQTRPTLYFTLLESLAGKLNLFQMANQLSTNAAKLFGMYPQKGVIKTGSDADIVIWNPAYEGNISHKNLLHNCDNTPFEGIRHKGRARDVLIKGEIAVENGKIVKKGLGEFIKRGRPQLYRA